MNLENLKTVYAFVRQHLVSIIFVILVLGGSVGGFLWNGFMELGKEKDKLASDRQSLSAEKIALEKNRADVTIELMARKAELDQREFFLSQLESQNKEGLAGLKHKETEYAAAFSKLQQAQSHISQGQRIKEAEESIQKMMSDFSEMGVNLNASLPCDNAEAQRRFNVAKAKYVEIYTLAEANNLLGRYQNFFFHNSPNSYHRCTN